MLTAMKKIGKYEVLREIGKGSFGVVYLVSHQGQEYALKTIAKRPRSAHEIRSLSEETQLLMKLRHENIIAMKESFQTADQIVVVMEYAGDDLCQLLEKKRLSEDKVRDYGRQILSAMLYLHENKVVHRDLKPANILLQGEQIKLCDFGFAKKMSAGTNFLMSIKGTPLYIAPEILQHRNYSHKVDVWSFGIILFELATGKTPFHAITIQQLQPKILHESVKFPPSMSPSLRDLIDGMLQKNDKKRLDWHQVNAHAFFKEESTKKDEKIEKNVVENVEKIEKQEKVKQIKWIADDQCAYMRQVEQDVESNKTTLLQLKFDEEFSLRAIQFLGEACLDRTKIPRETLLALLTRIVRIAKTKETKEGADLTKNRAVMTAVVTLAMGEQEDELLSVQLELMGYLLQQNFDKVQIDTEHDDQITTLIARKLTAKATPKSNNNCLKVLGILTSQALLTLFNSQAYFQRIAEEKLLSVVADLYSPSPESAIVLEALQKFLHPRFERTSQLTHATKALFRGFKEEVAPILLKRGLIGEQSPVGRPWKNPAHLDIYCEVVYELLTVSKEARTEFLKAAYWKQLLAVGRLRLLFLGMVQAILKGDGVLQLSSEVIQNEIVVQSSGNKLINVFLIYFAPHHFSQQSLRAAASIKRVEKLKITIGKVQEFLRIQNSLKSKWCRELLGFFSEEGRFFDDLLIETLHSLARDAPEEVVSAARAVAEEALLLPLSEASLSLCLDLMERQNKPWGASQLKRLDEFFAEMAREGFEDLLGADAGECGRLLSRLLRVVCQRAEEQGWVEQMAELIDRTQLLRLLFSEQLVSEELLLLVLRLTNRIFGKLKSTEFLAHGGFQVVRKYFKSLSEELRVEIMVFCSHLARADSKYCHQLLQNGVVGLCYRGLGQGEAVVEKALHLVGNLSKHSMEAFDQFQKYQITHCIHKCLVQYHINRKILKNAIYAIGNIAYYGEKFAFQIRETVKFLLQGLAPEDHHLLLNTVSTISNLLRHSSYHLQTLLDTGVFAKLIELYSSTPSTDQACYINNTIRKAANYQEFFKVYPKDTLRKLLEGNLRRGFLKENDNNVKWLKQTLAS